MFFLVHLFCCHFPLSYFNISLMWFFECTFFVYLIKNHVKKVCIVKIYLNKYNSLNLIHIFFFQLNVFKLIILFISALSVSTKQDIRLLYGNTKEHILEKDLLGAIYVRNLLSRNIISKLTAVNILLSERKL